jgi:hypothetical protein
MTRNPLASRLAVDFALGALKRGDLSEAATELTSALRADPENPDAFYHLARVYGLAGQDEAAVRVFALALQALPDEFITARSFVRYQGNAFDARTTFNFLAALAETTPTIRDYLKPSPIVGTYGPEQTAEQDYAIGELLDAKWSDWQSGRIQSPARSRTFLDAASGSDAPWPRTSIFMPRHVASNPDFVISTFATHTYESLIELGTPAEFHAADHLCFDSSNPDTEWAGRMPKAEALAMFESHLARFGPEVVVMDGMFIGSETALDLNDLARLKARFGFKLIVLVADSYPPLLDYAAYWAQLSDLTVSFTGEAYLNRIESRKTLFGPCQALASSLIRSGQDADRTIDFIYSGARTRNRDFWCAHAVMAGLDAKISITDKRARLAQSESEFYETLGHAKLVLSNGFVTPDLDIVTFRPFEAAASGTVTLHNGRALESCFTPYVHYTPFDNVHDLVCFSRFLTSHDDYRRRMSREAQSFFHSHYRGELFWRTLFARIG